MSKLRFDMVQGAFRKKAVTVKLPSAKTSDFFGELVFNREKMRQPRGEGNRQRTRDGESS